MPDIQMRFHQDMLVLSSPLDEVLRTQGFDDQDIDALCATEPETVLEMLRVQSAMGVPCLVTPTNAITAARLSHVRLADQQEALAKTAVSVVKRLQPQHILAEIGPTNLAVDPDSKTSMQANRDQYADACEAFATCDVDAFFLNGMDNTNDVLCAVMGARKVTDAPLFAAVVCDHKGKMGNATLEEALELMEEFEADVAGFRTSAHPDQAAALVERACRACDLPILVQLDVLEGAYDENDNPYADPDGLIAAAMRMRAAGAQFLQATGCATASHAGALAAATMGLDAIR